MNANDSSEGELIVILGIFAILALTIAVGLWVSRGSARRAREQTVLRVPIHSQLGSVVVALLGIVVVPVLVGVVGWLSDPWMRDHAAEAVLVSTAGGLLSLFLSLYLTRSLREVGSLVCRPDQLELKNRERTQRIDLTAPFELVETRAFGPQNMQLQVLTLFQDGRRLDFNYPMRLRQQASGEHGEAEGPTIGAVEGAVVHERLKSGAARS